MEIRVIVPCFNEEDIFESTCSELTKILDKDSIIKKYTYDILFIDDGSSDKTLDIIMAKTKFNKRIKYISFSKNFGKEAAMYAGLTHSKDKDAVIIIDADLQHPPELIPIMIEKFIRGTDQVIAKRDRKNENFLRKITTKTYYKLINKFVDVPITDGIGDFRLLSQRVVHAIVSMTESQRFSKGIFSWVGFKQEIIEYENKTRVAGQSKWSFKKLIDYGVDGVISFNNKPLRLLLYIGLLVCFFSIIYILITFINIMLYGINLSGYFTIIFAILFLGGIQLISISIIGEYVGRIYYEVKARPHYLIKKCNIDNE